MAILSGVTPFLLYHSTDIVLIEKNHLVQLKKAFLSDHNNWSYALFTLLFNCHSSNCQNHLVQLKMAFLSDHNKWSYASNFEINNQTFSTEIAMNLAFHHSQNALAFYPFAS